MSDDAGHADKIRQKLLDGPVTLYYKDEKVGDFDVELEGDNDD